MATYVVLQDIITGMHPVVYKFEAQTDEEAGRIFEAKYVKIKPSAVYRSTLCKVLKKDGR